MKTLKLFYYSEAITINDSIITESAPLDPNDIEIVPV
jgi:hypothetical protein